MTLLKSKKNKDINLISGLKEKRIGLSKKDILLPILILLGSVIFIALVVFVSFTVEQIESLRNRKLVQNTAETVAAWNKLSDSATAVDQIQNNLSKYQDESAKNEQVRGFINKVLSDIPSSIKISKISTDKTGQSTVEGSVSQAKQVYQYYEVLRNKSNVYETLELKAIDFNAQDREYAFVIMFKVK